jgi:hypothetical protein
LIITAERLTELARQECEKRSRRADIVSGYLIGSVAAGDPLVGGCADIDLVLVHAATPLRDREFVPLSAEVHHDILHLTRSDFDPPRRLRTQPDIVPELCTAVRLYDPDHFFDWVQAAACAQVDRPDNRLRRARRLLKQSRGLLTELAAVQSWQPRYCTAAIAAANACASLLGPPAAGRRLLPILRLRFDELGVLPLYARFLHLFRLTQSDFHHLPLWLSAWAKAYDEAMGDGSDDEAKAVRRDYYLHAFQALADHADVPAVLLPLLQTWPRRTSEGAEQEAEDEIASAYSQLLGSMHLSPSDLESRQFQLESFLDEVDLFLEDWGVRHGA